MATTLSYQWFRNGAEIAGATATTYTLTADDVGKLIEVEERATNEVGTTVRRKKVANVPIASSAAEMPPTPARVPAATTKFGGRAATTPQAWTDSVTVEMAGDDVDTGITDVDVTHTAQASASGLWSDVATWVGGVVPPAGAVVKIPSGVNVTYDVAPASAVALKDVWVVGTLKWATTQTKMIVDTIKSDMGSYVEIGTAAAPIPEATTDGQAQAHIVFKATEDPLATPRLGLMTHGKVRIHGAAKAHACQTVAPPKAADTTIKLRQTPTGWRVGDKVLIPSTTWAGTSTSDAQYAGPTSYWNERATQSGEKSAPDWRGRDFALSHDEVRTITAISGRTITLDSGLTHAHPAFTERLPSGAVQSVIPIVANLSRSIKLETDLTPLVAGDNSTIYRAHVMFMHHDDVDARWAEGLNMGRTKTDATLMTTSTAADPNDATRTPWNGLFKEDPATTLLTYADNTLADPKNVRGRYAWHIHRSGPFFSKKQVVFEGLTAWAPDTPQPGWAIVQHDSRAAFEKCVVYNVRGAGIVSENGSEIGQWLDNVVAWARGDGFQWDWGYRAERNENHNGHQGCGYENQARQILMQRNWASSCRVGFMYMTQDAAREKRVADQHSLRLFDPITLGGMESIVGFEFDDSEYGLEQPQIPDWNDQVAAGCDDGFAVAHRQFTDRTDHTPMLAKGFRAIGTQRAFNLVNYSYEYVFSDFLFADGGGTAIQIGTKSFGMSFANGYVEGFTDLLYSPEVNYNGFFIDIAYPQGVSFSSSAILTDTGTAPSLHSLYNVMGPARIIDDGSVDGVWTYSLRDVAIESSAALPVSYPGVGSDPNNPVGFGNHVADEPAPGTAKPYFWLDPASDVDLPPTGTSTISLKGIVVDEAGLRRWPSTLIMTDPANQEKDYRVKTNYHMTGLQIIQRNGCFTPDAGTTWKCRTWHTVQTHWPAGELQFYIDLTLIGFAQADLDANNIGTPGETPPDFYVLPLKPETI